MDAKQNPPVTVEVDDVHVKYQLRKRSKAKGLKAAKGLVAKPTVVNAVQGVTLTLREGDIVGLVGGNGAGKSTLLRCIAGVQPATSGQVLAVQRPLLLSVGAAMLGDISGRRNAYLGCLAQGLEPADAREAAEEAIAFAKLGEAIERPLDTYSSGMAARLRFAIATVRQHEILLVDEALSVGDKAFGKKAQARMRELSQAAGTVVIVSHSPTALANSCNRGLWMEEGKLVMDGNIHDVLAAHSEHQDRQS